MHRINLSPLHSIIANVHIPRLFAGRQVVIRRLALIDFGAQSCLVLSITGSYDHKSIDIESDVRYEELGSFEKALDEALQDISHFYIGDAFGIQQSIDVVDRDLVCRCAVHCGFERPDRSWVLTLAI